MSDRAWMPLDIDDYMADTNHLSAAEHGAYMLLIMRYWKDGQLPQDERLIQRYSRLSVEQWAESRDIIAAFFGDGWSHKRIDAELERASAIIEKRRSAASAKHSKSKLDAHALQVQSKSTDTGVPPSTTEPSSSLRSDDRVPAEPTTRQHLERVIDPNRAKALVDHRKRIGKPMTPRAAELMAGKLARCPDPNAAADAIVANGWQGFEPEWLTNRSARAGPGERPVDHLIDSLVADMDYANANAPAEIEGYQAPSGGLPARQW
jgi:uncharacterized protein YdaU (DUF1376 family)